MSAQSWLAFPQGKRVDQLTNAVTVFSSPARRLISKVYFTNQGAAASLTVEIRSVTGPTAFGRITVPIGATEEFGPFETSDGLQYEVVAGADADCYATTLYVDGV